MLNSRNWVVASAMAAAFVALPMTTLHAQAAAATICKDGTTSLSSGKGACSGHGGVDKKAVSHQKKVVKSETKAAKEVTKKTAGTQVTTVCADGTKSNSTGKGTCSGHGGARGAEATSKTTGAVVRAPATAAPPSPYTPPIPKPSATTKTTGKTRSTTVGSGAADDNNPAGAIARCKDGLYSHARNHEGACGCQEAQCGEHEKADEIGQIHNNFK